MADLVPALTSRQKRPADTLLEASQTASALVQPTRSTEMKLPNDELVEPSLDPELFGRDVISHKDAIDRLGASSVLAIAVPSETDEVDAMQCTQIGELEDDAAWACVQDDVAAPSLLDVTKPKRTSKN